DERVGEAEQKTKCRSDQQRAIHGGRLCYWPSAAFATCQQAPALTERAMDSDRLQLLAQAVRDVPDFPKPGIVFKDITPILGDGKLFRMAIEAFLEQCRGKQIDKIVGIDARGFLFGSAVAYDLGVGFVPLRKKGRLPYKTES